MGPIAAYRGWRQRRRLAITCRAAVELATDYLEDALGPTGHQRVERHLRHCAPCVRILDQLRATTDVLGRLRPDRLDPTTRDRLIELHRASRRA